MKNKHLDNKIIYILYIIFFQQLMNKNIHHCYLTLRKSELQAYLCVYSITLLFNLREIYAMVKKHTIENKNKILFN